MYKDKKGFLGKIKYEIKDLIAHKKENLLKIINKANLDQENIKFISIGANDGVVNDPLAPYIYKYKWEGIFIEPLPQYFKELKKNYGNNQNISLENIAINNKEGFKDICFISSKAPFITKLLGKRLASFHKKVIEDHSWYIPKIKQNIEKMSVPVKPLNYILEKYNYWDANIVIIDVEGHELKIIKTIDFKKFQPKIIYFEIKHLSKDDEIEAKEILKNEGYALSSLGRDCYGIKKTN
ncbi:MAG: FkbM family methyltransferase [Candidatus Paceibacterota bacterium]